MSLLWNHSRCQDVINLVQIDAHHSKQLDTQQMCQILKTLSPC
jgi:hypothetical protein